MDSLSDSAIRYVNAFEPSESGEISILNELTQNSNSFVATLLASIGVDVLDYVDQMLVGDPFSGLSLPGINTNVLNDQVSDPLPDNGVPLSIVDQIGNDNVFVAGTGSDSISSGAGSDILFVGANADFIDAGADSDVVFGGSGDDTIFLGDGDDIVSGGTGFDTIDGGAGFDTLTYADLGLGVSESNGILVDFRGTLPGSDLISSFEGVIGSEHSDVFFSSAEGGEYIAGGGSNDILRTSMNPTGSAPTVFWGGVGSDKVYLEAGEYDADPFGSGWSINAPGVLVANVSGLNEFNFPYFRLDMLGIPADLLAEIDVVIINPDSEDRIYIESIDEDTDLPTGQYFPVSSGSASWSGIPGVTPISSSYDVGNYLLEVGANVYDVFAPGSFLSGLGWVAFEQSQQTNGSLSAARAQVFTNPDFFSNGASGWFVVEGDVSGNSIVASQSAEFSFDMSGFTSGLLEALSIPVSSTEVLPDQIVEPDPATPAVEGTDTSEVIDSSYSDGNGLTINDGGQVIRAFGGNDIIYDGAGDDFVYGGAGGDKMYSNYGADHYDGGDASFDEVRYFNSPVGLTIDMRNAANSTGFAEGDTYANVERIHATNFDDIIILAAGVNLHDARNGADHITDGAGFEYVKGGAGDDTFAFVAGDGEQDVIKDFTFGADKIDLSAWGVTDFAELTIVEETDAGGGLLGKIAVSFGAESILLEGLNIADISSFSETDFGLGGTPVGDVQGTSGIDTIDDNYTGPNGVTLNDNGQTIIALGGNDIIYGGAGDDVINGGDGGDKMYGHLGSDHYDGGGSSFDEVRYFNSSVGLVIDMVNSSNSTGFAAGDTYVNVERIHGTNYADTITLTSGVSVHDARGGDDHITDGAGFEYIKGGAGADTFAFVAGDSERDQIKDFTIGTDLIDLTAWGVTGMNDLTIYEDSGVLFVDMASEGIRLEGLDGSDIASLTASSFVFI